MEPFVEKILGETTKERFTAREVLEAAQKIFTEREDYYNSDWKQYPGVEARYRRDNGYYLLGIAELIDALFELKNQKGKGIPYPEFLCVDTTNGDKEMSTPENDDPWGDFIGSYC